MRREVAQTDVIYNGQSYGEVADLLMEVGNRPELLRPWRGSKGRSFLTINTGRVQKGENGKLYPVLKNVRTSNASLLRKDEWLAFDEAIIGEAEARCRVWADVAARNQLIIPNGMGSTVLQQQTMTDAGDAMTTMDALEEEGNDRPLFGLTNLPLPITHAGFRFSARDIAVTRKMGTPLDTTMAIQCTRRVIERVEKMIIGALANYSYGGGTIYGVRTFPERIGKTITLPTAAGWSPELHLQEVLDMRQAAKDVQFHGPYALYYSTGWAKYLDDNFSAAYNGETLRSRISKIKNVVVIDDADYIANYEVMMVQLTGDTIRAINGMNIGMIQYGTHGGLARRFKIMCIYVPQIRNNANGDCGIVHAVAA